MTAVEGWVDELNVCDNEALKKSVAMYDELIGLGVMVTAMNNLMMTKVNKID